MNGLLYFFPFLLTAFATFGLKTGSFAVYFGAIILLVAHPIVDNVARLPTPVFNDDDEDPGLYDFSLLTMPFIITGFLIGSIRLFDTSQATFEIFGRILSTGIITGALGITAAHELIHRPKAWQRALGIWLLNIVMFGHFRIEHVYLHHKNVATPDDLYTAKYNQNVFSYIFKHFLGSLPNSWNYEAHRLSAGNTLSQLFGNRVLHYLFIQLFIGYSLFSLWGAGALLFWIAQSVVAYALLMTVNYLEHYGLTRKKLPNGEYEPQNESHTWDIDLNFSNICLFNLGLHAHHHKKAHIPFYKLQSLPHARILPFGISLMLILAFIPPLFKSVVHPLLEAQPQDG